MTVTATGVEPESWRDLIAPIAGAETDASGSIRAANGAVEVVDDEAFADAFGVAAPSGPFRLAAVTFGVASLAAAEALFRQGSILHHRIRDRLVVPPTPGQGAAFAFEENS